MKIAHITTENIYGAGRAAQRIVEVLNQNGIVSDLFVVYGKTNKNVVFLNDGSLFERALSKAYRIRCEKMKHNGIISNLFHIREKAVIYKKYDVLKEYDLIHLHWLGEGIYSPSFLKFLSTLNKPIVWTMHDMWTFTAGCNYSNECTKYRSVCEGCFGVKKRWIDKELKIKILMYSKLKIQFVGCSKWITEEFNSSQIARCANMHAVVVPNPKPTTPFEVRNKIDCRNMLGIKTDKKMLLFGASGATTDPRKGFSYLLDAIKGLDREEFCIGVFGGTVGDSIPNDYDVYEFGVINDDLHLSIIYGAADIFVAPSTQENQANTVMEALACGIPCVAFYIGGMPDMIIDGKNGFLAHCVSSEDLKGAINKAKELVKSRERYCLIEEYDAIGGYIAIYEQCKNSKI